jgi:hypothetical protein
MSLELSSLRSAVVKSNGEEDQRASASASARFDPCRTLNISPGRGKGKGKDKHGHVGLRAKPTLSAPLSKAGCAACGAVSNSVLVLIAKYHIRILRRPANSSTSPVGANNLGRYSSSAGQAALGIFDAPMPGQGLLKR